MGARGHNFCGSFEVGEKHENGCADRPHRQGPPTSQVRPTATEKKQIDKCINSGTCQSRFGAPGFRLGRTQFDRWVDDMFELARRRGQGDGQPEISGWGQGAKLVCGPGFAKNFSACKNSNQGRESWVRIAVSGLRWDFFPIELLSCPSNSVCASF